MVVVWPYPAVYCRPLPRERIGGKRLVGAVSGFVGVLPLPSRSTEPPSPAGRRVGWGGVGRGLVLPGGVLPRSPRGEDWGGLADEGGVAVGAYADEADGDVDELFEFGDVGFGVEGEVGEVSDVGDFFGPAGEGFVDGGGAGQHFGVGGEVVDPPPILPFVGHCDFQGVETGEDVEHGEGEVGCAAEVGGVFDGDGVEVTAATRAAGGGAVLVTSVADAIADVVVLFGGEGACTDAGGVGLHDADEVLDGLRRHASAGEEAERRAVGGGDVGIGAVVDVEEGGVSAFEEDGLLRAESVDEHLAGVTDEGGEALAVGAEGGEDGGGIEGGFAVEGGEDLVALGDDGEDFAFEGVFVDEVCDADGGGPVHFLGVGGADPAPGGPEGSAFG